MALDVALDPGRSSPFSWPRTHRPSSKSRSLWRSALFTVFTRPTDAQVLMQPLLPHSPSVSSSWLWKFSPSEQRLFLPNESSWDFHHVSAGRRQSRNRTHRHGGSIDSLPDDVLSATVRLHGSQAHSPPNRFPRLLSPRLSRHFQPLRLGRSRNLLHLSLIHL